MYRYAHLLTIRWAQGRLGELWPEIEDHAERFPWIPRWRDALAAAEIGDTARARRELERFAARDFADLPRDGLWLLHLCSLAEACVLVHDEQRAQVLYDLLLPHAEDNAVSYTQQPFGPVAYRLGRLATLLGRRIEADRHFATALARCELLGAQAIRARVLAEHAHALERRGEPADRVRVEAMRDEAARLCDELGIDLPLPAADVGGAAFRREGEFWTIAWNGTTFRVRDVKGLGYIAVLLGSPGRRGPCARARRRSHGRCGATAAPCSTSRRRRSTGGGSPSWRRTSSRRARGATPSAPPASRRRASS